MYDYSVRSAFDELGYENNHWHVGSFLINLINYSSTKVCIVCCFFPSIFITIFTSVTLLHCATVTTLPQTHHHAWGKRSRFYMLGRLPKLKKSSFWCQLEYDYPDVIWTLSLLYYEHCPKSFHMLVHPGNSRVGNSYELFLGPLAALGSKVNPPLHLEIGQNVWLTTFQLYMEKYQQW